MHTKRAILVRFLMIFLPETSFWGLKNGLWRWAGVKIGRNVRICSSAVILGNGSLEIGDNTWLGHQVMLNTGCLIKIGSNVDVGPRVYIGTGTHRIDVNGMHAAGEGIQKEVWIDSGSWIGAGAIILPGVHLGEKTVIGAGALVRTDIPSRTLAAGVPAKIKKSL